MKWIIQFLIGESRLLELWDQAHDNAVVQLFDPGHRSKFAKFVYHWLSFVLPIGCFVMPFALGLNGGFGRLSSFLAGTFGFLVACCFIGAIALPVFGMIVLRGRLHEREGLEQLCLTPLGRDEIAFGAVYWPIKFCFRALTLLFVLTWLMGLVWLFHEIAADKNFDGDDFFEVVSGITVGGMGANLVFASFALASLMVSTRAALSLHGGRWRLIYRAAFEMVPHALWLLAVIFGSIAIAAVVGSAILERAEDFLQIAVGGAVGLAVGVALVKFQLTYMMRLICFDGPSLFFEEIREPDEPQPIWGKAEWAIVRSTARRRPILDELRAADHYPVFSEFLPAILIALGFITGAIICINVFENAFPFDSYGREEDSQSIMGRMIWMIFGPGVVFVFPTVLWLSWWLVFGRKRVSNTEAIRRDAPLFSAIYGLWRMIPAWAVPIVLLGLGLLTSRGHLSRGVETFFSSTAWLMFVTFGIILSCIVSLQVQVSQNPRRTANYWLGIAFAYIMAAGYRGPGDPGRIWKMDDDVVFTALAGVFLCGTAVVYILPVAGHTARHRGLDAPNDDEEEKNIDSLI